jgi:hypothetical protein
VKAAIIGIHALADYSVGPKDRQQAFMRHYRGQLC